MCCALATSSPSTARLECCSDCCRVCPGPFPGRGLRIRLEAGFSGPELYAFFEAHKLEYVVGLAKNAGLTALAELLMAEARSDFEAGQQTTGRYG